MRKESFTLLETLVALVVIAMFIATGMGANRVIRRSAAERLERETMQNIAQDSVRMFETWRDQYVGTANPDISQNTLDGKLFLASGTVTGAFYAVPTTCGTNSKCSRAQNGGPLTIMWCKMGSGLGECPANVLKAFDTSNTTDVFRSTTLSSDFKDIVGVANTDYCPKDDDGCLKYFNDNNPQNTHAFVDVTNPLLSASNSDSLGGYNSSLEDLPFAMYRRIITIKKPTTGDFGNNAAYTIDVSVSSDLSDTPASDRTYTEHSLVIFAK